MYTDLWATAVNGATTASSITLVPFNDDGCDGMSDEALIENSVVRQYTGGGTLLSAGFQTSGASVSSSTQLATVSVTTGVANAYVISAMATEALSGGGMTYAAVAGTIRSSSAINAGIYGALVMDNTSASAGSVTTSETTTSTSGSTTMRYGAVAVELDPPAPPSSSPLPLLFNFLLPAPWLVWDQAAQFPAP